MQWRTNITLQKDTQSAHSKKNCTVIDVVRSNLNVLLTRLVRLLRQHTVLPLKSKEKMLGIGIRRTYILSVVRAKP
jgi:hypothetical protein